MGREPTAWDLPGTCYARSDRSLGVYVSNESSAEITNVAFAYLKYDEVFWSPPITLASSLRPGKSKWMSLTRKNVRIIEFIIKYSAEGRVYRAEQVPILHGTDLHFIRCIGFSIHQVGIHLLWPTTQKL